MKLLRDAFFCFAVGYVVLFIWAAVMHPGEL